MGYIAILLIVSLAVALLDVFMDFMFPNIEILANFNLYYTLTDGIFMLGSLVLWVGYFIERLTTGDLMTPLNLLYRIIISLGFIFLGGAVDFIFDIIVLPFNLISEFAGGLGISTKLYVKEAGQYVEFDLATFTLRIGIALDLLGNGATALFQISFLGCDSLSPSGTRFSFPSMGFVGVYAKASLLVLGQRLGLPIKLELEAFVKELVNTVFRDHASVETIYEEILEALKRLGVIP